MQQPVFKRKPPIAYESSCIWTVVEIRHKFAGHQQNVSLLCLLEEPECLWMLNSRGSAFIWAVPPPSDGKQTRPPLDALAGEGAVEGADICSDLDTLLSAVLKNSLRRAEGGLFGSFDSPSHHKQVGQATVIAFILTIAAASLRSMCLNQCIFKFEGAEPKLTSEEVQCLGH